jgi:predicted amidohydrolase
MKVAAVQHDIDWEQPEKTRARVEPLIADAAARGARLIALTEMYATGFSMHPERIAEDEGGPSEAFLIDQARTHDLHVVASIAQRGPDGKYRNNAVLAAPSGDVHRYAKIHPFSYAGEHERYAAGDTFVTVDVEGVRVSLFVCYDLRFADEFWARAADTDLYVVPANWPEPRREHWRTLLRARAIENQAYVVGINRVGAEKKAQYVGDSAIVDPLGRTLAEAAIGESVLVADVDPETVKAVRTAFPFFADRRK